MDFILKDDNSNLIKRLIRVVEEDKISHAYIFEGPSCVDKQSFVKSFIKGILCHDNYGNNCGKCSVCAKIDNGNHEDLIYVCADGKSIKDADIIDMQEKLKSKPFGGRHIVIISDSDTMTQRAQNRLLKTLEEPPGKSVIILISENIENLVQTIQSRCVKYRINFSGSDNYDYMMEKAEAIAKMAIERAAFYKMKKSADSIMKSAEDTGAFLDSLQVVYRNMLVNKEKGISLYKDEDIIRNIHEVEKARQYINRGVALDYAVKNLLLKIGG